MSNLPVYNSQNEWNSTHIIYKAFADFKAQKYIMAIMFVAACFGLLSFWWLLPVVVLFAITYPVLDMNYYMGARCFSDGTGPRINFLWDSYADYRKFADEYRGDLKEWLKAKGIWQDRFEGKTY